MKKYLVRIFVCMFICAGISWGCYLAAYQATKRDEGEQVYYWYEEDDSAVYANMNMKYIEVEYHKDNGTEHEEEKVLPVLYAGMDEEELNAYFKQYMQNPSKEDVMDGLSELKIRRFERNRLEIVKIYEEYGVPSFPFFVKLHDGQLYVYQSAGGGLVVDTGILEEEIPFEDRHPLKLGRYIKTAEEIYELVDKYSSN